MESSSIHSDPKLKEAVKNKSNESLWKSHAQLLEILGNTTDGFFTLNRQWQYTFLNSSAGDMMHRNSEDLLGKIIWEEFPEAIDTEFAKLYHEVMSTGLPASIVEYYKPLEGWYEISITPNHEGISVLYRDITKRKNVEEELERQKSIFEQMFIQSSTSTQILDKDGWCLRINPKLSELFGVKAENIEGRLYNIFKDGEIIRNGIDKILEKVFYEKQTVTWEANFDITNAASSQNIDVEKREKTWYSNKAYPIVDNTGELMYVVIQHENITERKQAEEALRESEELLRTTFDNATTGVALTGTDGRFIMINSTLCNMFGYTAGELKSLKFNDITYQEDKITGLSFLNNLISGKIKNACFEKRYVHKNGNIIWAFLSIGLVSQSNLKPKYFVTHILDITARKKAEEALILAKKEAEKSDKLKSEFLAQMSHEIRSPISTMLNFISLIKDEVSKPLSEEMIFSFNAIDSSSRRLIRTIDLILNMSQVQSGYLDCSYQMLDLEKDVLVHVINEYSTSALLKGLNLSFLNESGSSGINADSYTVIQIFSNLVNNAIKYTKKGNIVIRLYKNAENNFSVDVSDTGIGISEEYIDQIFTPFSQEEQGYTRKFEGNGLGLALVKKYCELNNAKVSVKSKKGEGSIFTVTFYPFTH